MIAHPESPEIGTADAWIVAIDAQEERVARGEDLRRALKALEALHSRGQAPACDARCHWPPLYVPGRPNTIEEDMRIATRAICSSCEKRRRMLDPRTMRPEHWGMCAACALGAPDEGDEDEDEDDEDEVPESEPAEIEAGPARDACRERVDIVDVIRLLSSP